LHAFVWPVVCGTLTESCLLNCAPPSPAPPSAQGGLGRWIWFIPILIAWCPPAQAQYFCDQLLAFARDHGVGPENAPLVRP